MTNPNGTATDIAELFNADLDAGNFGNRVARAISDVALGAINNPKKTGSITITLSFSALGNSGQVKCDHKLSFSKPTEHGKSSEDHTKTTPLHVGYGGKVSLFPEDQTQMFTAKGEPQKS